MDSLLDFEKFAQAYTVWLHAHLKGTSLIPS